MGVYAESEVEISCKTKKSTNKIYKMLKKVEKEQGENFEIDNVKKDYWKDVKDKKKDIGGIVYGRVSTCRARTFDYDTGELWKFIKDIEGVGDLSCPVMKESDGYSFSN